MRRTESLRRTAWLRRLGWTAVLAASVAVAPTALAQGDDERAKELFAEGIAASKEERWADARRALAQALELKQAPIILYSLAVAERNTGKLVAALTHFRAFLDEPVTPKTEAFQAPAREAVADLEGRVAHLAVSLDPPGAELRLNGEVVDREGPGEDLLVDPGDHVVSAVAPGHAEARSELELAPGETRAIALTLLPLESGDAPASDELAVGPIALMGAGGGLMLVGAGLWIAAFVQADAVTSRQQADAERDGIRATSIAGDVIFGVGAAAAGAGLIWLLVGGDDDEAAAWRPWFGAGGDVAGVELRF